MTISFKISPVFLGRAVNVQDTGYAKHLSARGRKAKPMPGPDK
jgi:hypothetical protein